MAKMLEFVYLHMDKKRHEVSCFNQLSKILSSIKNLKHRISIAKVNIKSTPQLNLKAHNIYGARLKAMNE